MVHCKKRFNTRLVIIADHAFVRALKMGAGITMTVPFRALADYCRQHHVRRLLLFGSALRDDFRPESDVDLLAEFEPDNVPGLIGLGTIARQLSEIFEGRNIDLHTPGSLNPAFRSRVLREAQVLFDATAR